MRMQKHTKPIGTDGHADEFAYGIHNKIYAHIRLFYCTS